MALSDAAKFATAYLGKVIDREKDKTAHIEVVVRPCDMREIIDAAERSSVGPQTRRMIEALAGIAEPLDDGNSLEFDVRVGFDHLRDVLRELGLEAGR